MSSGSLQRKPTSSGTTCHPGQQILEVSLLIPNLHLARKFQLPPLPSQLPLIPSAGFLPLVPPFQSVLYTSQWSLQLTEVQIWGLEDRVQQLRMPTALARDPGSVLKTHKRAHNNLYGIQPSLLPPEAPGTHVVYTRTWEADTHTHNTKINNPFSKQKIQSCPPCVLSALLADGRH